MALTALATLKTLLTIGGTGEDTRLNQVVDAANDIISRWCDRTFESTSYTEDLDGTGTPVLPLRHYPIIGNPTSVNVDGNRDFIAATLLTIDDDYVIDEDGVTGILRTVAGVSSWGLAEPVWPRGTKNVRVVYTAGYATIPDGLVHIATQYAAFLYRNRGTMGPMAVNVGGVSVRWDSLSPGVTVDMLPDVFKNALSVWRRMDIEPDELFERII